MKHPLTTITPIFTKSARLLAVLSITLITIAQPVLAEQTLRQIVQAPAYDPDFCSTNNAAATGTSPVVVLDPGHSGGQLSKTEEIDSATASGSYNPVNITGSGIKTEDNGGAPDEIDDMWKAANRIKDKLTTAGYTVVLTKSSPNANVGLLSRAKIANDNNAAIAVSLHYTGEARFGQHGPGDNWGVTPQEVGRYRQDRTTSKRATFTDATVAAASQKYAQAIQKARAAAGDPVNLRPLIDSFTPARGLQSFGDISIVQLFSKVPWIYNEDGKQGFDLQKYSDGIANGIMAAVPITSPSGATVTNASNVTPVGKLTQATVTAYGTLISTNRQGNLVTGYSPAQAAAILGNLMWESGAGTSGDLLTNKSDGVSYGIAQWLGSRLTNMRNFVRGEGKAVDSLDGQLDFLSYELNNDYKSSRTQLLANKGNDMNAVDTLTEQFMTSFERPGIPHLSERQQNARLVFTTLSNTPASQLAVPSSACGAGAAQNVGGTVDCQSATGNAKILCEAKKYDGIYYSWGGAHGSYDSFRAACPFSQLAGAPKSPAANSSSAGNPGPCGTDCSGLVSVAVDAAFGQKFTWSVSNSSDASMVGGGANYWRPQSLNSLQPGDIVTHPGHVEIVDHASGNTVWTFGSHQTGKKTGQISTSINYWTKAFRYTGPGATVSL